MAGFVKVIPVLFSVMLIHVTSVAQKTYVVEGEYQMQIDNSMSLDKAEQTVERRARLKAIEDKLGSSVMQHHVSTTSNVQTGKDAVTKTDFDFLDESSVNGDWIGDIGKPVIEYTFRDNEKWIHAKVKGTIREKTTASTRFEASPLSCPKPECRAVTFNDGQDVYLYFKAPERGYLSVYLADPEYKKTLQLLPYKSSHKFEKYVPVEADKEYILFDKAADWFNEGAGTIDGLVEGVSNDADIEIAELFILFSSEPLDKPVLSDINAQFLSKAELTKGYTLPKGTGNDEFQSWLQDYLAHNSKVQFMSINFDIKKK